MKTLLLLSMSLVAVPFASYAAPMFEVGESVAIRWESGSYQRATVEKATETDIFIYTLASNSPQNDVWLNCRKVKSIDSTGIQVGKEAIIYWDNGANDQVIITGISEDGYCEFVKKSQRQLLRVSNHKVHRLVNNL